MGPSENPTDNPKNQERTKPKRVARRPRTRRCLLKGCEARFRPRRAAERYCSDKCRAAAREWHRWKAQQAYRDTSNGRKKRNAQGRRYRKRFRERNQCALPAAGAAARVIQTNIFFRRLLRPARLLREVRTHPEIAAATVLFEGVPAGSGARLGAGTALARGPSRMRTPTLCLKNTRSGEATPAGERCCVRSSRHIANIPMTR